MTTHIIDKENTKNALRKINSLLQQTDEIITKVNKDEQWDYCTDDQLARLINETDHILTNIKSQVFEQKH